MKTPVAIVLLAAFVLVSPIIAYSQDTSKSLWGSDTAFVNLRELSTRVAIESEFPGGAAGWLKFLNSHLVYPNKALRKKIEGTVLLQFIVDKEGNLSNLYVVSGDSLLAEAAIKAMSKSPKWIPATVNGQAVKSYKKQPIVFKLQ
jgi:TonB family protein